MKIPEHTADNRNRSPADPGHGKKNGGSDGARTRNIHRDRVAL